MRCVTESRRRQVHKSAVSDHDRAKTNFDTNTHQAMKRLPQALLGEYSHDDAVHLCSCIQQSIAADTSLTGVCNM